MLNFLLSLSYFIYLFTSASGGKPRCRVQELPSGRAYARSLEACAWDRLYEKTVSGKCSSTAIHGTDVPPAGTVTVESHVQVEVDSEFRCTARIGRNSDLYSDDVEEIMM